MPARLASNRPLPYLSAQNPLLHSGVLTMTGTTVTVDLGLGHDNFVVSVSMMVPSPAATDFIAWKRGTRRGTFIITTNAAMAVSFVAIAGASAA